MNESGVTNDNFDDRLLATLRDRGALLEGRFKLSSGRHSDRFVQKFRLLEWPELVGEAAAELIARMRPEAPTVVVSAAVGGIVLGFETARRLSVRSIFVEKEGGVPTLRRGFSLSAADRVVVVEDVITTGGSVREVLEIVERSGAAVLGAGVIVRRGTAELGVPITALLDMPLASYEPAECPQCAAGTPLADPGSRRSG